MKLIRKYYTNGTVNISGKERGTFTGEVLIDSLHADTEISLVNVNFAPCSRTYWHTHQNGQLIRVIAGSGWICDKGDKPQRISDGDIVWCPPGTTHWHGADDGSYMVHQATSYGKTSWHEEVSDGEYKAKASS
ncbi:RmlC-like cupin domain-containing protein [Xylogone sp. PMI_703]|nr:RmlC-like cupin domain-containing protein [Xylogone sp. PMI_703]